MQDTPDATADEVVDAVDDWTPNGEERYGIATWPLSLLLLLPVAASVLAFQAVTKRKSSKVVMGAMYATLFGALLSQQLIIFIPTVIGVGIASYQVRKAEAAASFAAEVMEGGDGGDDHDDLDDDDIIDVEEAIDAEEASESDELIEAEVEARRGRRGRGRSAKRLSDLAQDPRHLEVGFGVTLERGVVGDLLGQAPQREGDGVGLGLGHVDAVAAEAMTDLLLLEGEGLRAGCRVEAVLEHRPRRLGDDPYPLVGMHGAQVATRGGSSSRIAGSSSKYSRRANPPRVAMRLDGTDWTRWL